MYWPLGQVSIHLRRTIVISIFRGKSPVYDGNSNLSILNQKCNRWNEIKLEYSKTVDKNWYESIKEIFFTKKGDILVNSTGEAIALRKIDTILLR